MKDNVWTLRYAVSCGIVLNMLIDSGAQCNIVDKETWKKCKDKEILCESSKRVSRNVYP